MSEEIDSAMRVAEAAARERIAALLDARATELAARGEDRCAHVLREVHAQLKGNAYIPLEVRDAMAAKRDPGAALARVVAAAQMLVAPAAAGDPDPLAPLEEDGCRVCVACGGESRILDDTSPVLHRADCPAEGLRAALAALDAAPATTTAHEG